MIRIQIALTEDQMRRVRTEARRRRVSFAAVIRDAVDRAVSAENVLRDEAGQARLETLLSAAGSVASGTGSVARDHDDVFEGEPRPKA